MKYDQKSKIANAIARELNSRRPDQGVENASIARDLTDALDTIINDGILTESTEQALHGGVSALVEVLISTARDVQSCGAESAEDFAARKDDGNRVSEEERARLA